MGTAGASRSNGSGSGSSNAALLAASSGKSGSGTPTHGAGDGITVAPASGTDGATGDESRPFLGAAATTESSGESSRDRSGERGAPASQEQLSGREGPGFWGEIDREAAEREHERQVEETRQRRELARAFLLQAKERQEQRIPLLNRGGGEASSLGAGGAALAGAAVAAGSKSQPRQGNPKAQHTQQWWQSSPPGSPPPGSPPPPTAAHANTPAYQPIYPPISPTYPVSGPILTSQHIEQNRLQQAQHAHATSRATSPTYPSFHRPRPSYPSPSWSQAQQNTYNQLNNGDSASAYNSSKGYTSGGYSFSGRPFFHQNTSYNPPHRSYSNYSQPSGINNGTYSYGGSSYSHYSTSSYGGHRRGSSGSVHNNAVGGVYTTIPEEDPPHQPQQQSLHQIMHQMNSLDDEDSADEGQGFLKVPRRVLSVRNGAVTPSSDGDESTDERDGGGRRPRMM
ncbi:hypothetical protein MPH_07194 [Macrophomina phaseolina MS6]|uniref:Uncharacterized protein n=1 Tax=Macrophomina phaseolina (strain MS6) TaxID=1126212 RepID=K2RZV1_MACPH|nr:hypothetical protein MPH_07194 [Macrophomina phaseolina MS6]